MKKVLAVVVAVVVMITTMPADARPKKQKRTEAQKRTNYRRKRPRWTAAS